MSLAQLGPSAAAACRSQRTLNFSQPDSRSPPRPYTAGRLSIGRPHTYYKKTRKEKVDGEQFGAGEIELSDVAPSTVRSIQRRPNSLRAQPQPAVHTGGRAGTVAHTDFEFVLLSDLSVRLLADADAEAHVLEALHGAEVRAEDDPQAQRVAGVALGSRAERTAEADSGGTKNRKTKRDSDQI